jgi:1,2-phenylacetyl-CoA epoxidase PaaB subunit
MGGERDGRTRPEAAREVFDRVPGAKDFWVVPGADHEDLLAVVPLEYQQRVLAFIAAAK